MWDPFSPAAIAGRDGSQGKAQRNREEEDGAGPKATDSHLWPLQPLRSGGGCNPCASKGSANGRWTPSHAERGQGTPCRLLSLLCEGWRVGDRRAAEDPRVTVPSSPAPPAPPGRLLHPSLDTALSLLATLGRGGREGQWLEHGVQCPGLDPDPVAECLPASVIKSR